MSEYIIIYYNIIMIIWPFLCSRDKGHQVKDTMQGALIRLITDETESPEMKQELGVVFDTMPISKISS